MLPRCLLLVLCLIAGGRMAAQDMMEPLFHRISLEEGLSDLRVNAIVQDKYGFMWFGTANGLNRYDGYNIKVYEKGESGLGSNNIGALFCSKAGILYVGDGDGLLEYNYTTDRFARPKGSDSAELNTKSHTVTLMEEDGRGRIYIGCAEGFFRYSPATARMEDMNKLLGSGGRIQAISGLTFGKDGRLWVTTQKEGFYIVNPANNTYAEVPHDATYGEAQCCYAIHRTVFLDDDHLLVGQHSYGFTILDTRSLKFDHQPGMMGRNNSVRFNAVYRLIKDYKGRIWAGTAYFGIIQYLPRSRGIIEYKNDPFNPNSYGGYRVRYLYEDREHNIWVGTGGYGLYRFNPDKAAVRYYPWSPIGTSTPPGPEVLSAAPRDSQSVWIGTDRGPATFDFNTGVFSAYRYDNAYDPTLPGSNIIYLYTDKAGYVWMSSRHLGISRYDPGTGKFLRFIYITAQDLPSWQQSRIPATTIPGNLISCVSEDPSGNILLLINRRIAVFDSHRYKSRYFTTDSTEPILRIKDITGFYADGSGLVVGTETGGSIRILHYSFATKAVQELAVIDSADKSSLRQVQPMPDGNILAATTNGIYIIQRDSRNAPRHYVWPGGGMKTRILGAVTGLPGFVWVCTDRHIGRVDLTTGEWLWLGNSEGLKPTRFFGDAFRLLPDGRIIAGSGDGLFLIDPSAVSSSVSQAPVLVDFKVFGKTFPLPEPLQDVHEIRLAYGQNFFSFGMSTLRFGESSNTEYGYMLDGYDKEWQPAGADRSGQYTGVPGGSYNLLLRARTGTSAWVIAPQKVRIVIARPWWGTWAFRAISALLLLALIGSIYVYRIRAIREAARLRSEYEIRLNELEMSALRTQMNPHFIFNCLNTINSYINSNQKAQANHYITRFAKLIRLILENSRQRRIALSKELEALHLYFQLESLRFENRFAYSIVVDDSLDTDNVEVPPLVLQPFVENAILHGILPRPGSGNISVRIQQKNTLVMYVVEDDGIGREAAKKRSAEGALQKESHGIAITQKRIELFNRENGVNATVLVEDLVADGVAAGTKVIIPLAFVEGF